MNTVELDLFSVLLGKKTAKVLETFDNIRELGKTTISELLEKGVTRKVANKIKAIFDIAKKHNSEVLKKGEKITGSEAVYKHFNALLRDEDREKFYAVLLDTKNRIIKNELISIGSLNLSVVHPREVFKPAIKESACSIVLVHNHPSGDPTPSREDIDITQRLRDVARVVGIEILDHIIIGDNRYVSFVEKHLI